MEFTSGAQCTAPTTPGSFSTPESDQPTLPGQSVARSVYATRPVGPAGSAGSAQRKRSLPACRPVATTGVPVTVSSNAEGNGEVVTACTAGTTNARSTEPPAGS